MSRMTLTATVLIAMTGVPVSAQDEMRMAEQALDQYREITAVRIAKDCARDSFDSIEIPACGKDDRALRVAFNR